MAENNWIITIADGVKICVPADINLMTTYVLLEQEDWFEAELPFLRELVEPGMGILDIGANHGVYALSLAKRLNGQGRVIACEPASAPADRLEVSITANDFAGQLTLLRLGLSDHAGDATLHIGPNSELNSLSDNDVSHQGATEIIRLTTLDALFERPEWPTDWAVDLLKLDAEGEEIRILKGGTRFFAEQDPLVLFEWKHGSTPNTGLLEAFVALGLELYRFVPGLAALVPVAHNETLDGYQLNLFACKPSRAQRLRAVGRLLTHADLLTAAPPSARHWRETPGALAFVSADGQMLPAWQTFDGAGDRCWPVYEQALDAYLSAIDVNQPLPARWAWLQQSRRLLKGLQAHDSHLATRMLHIRVLGDSGERAAAVKVNEELVRILEQNPPIHFDRPFLSPLSAYDRRPPVDNSASWLNAAVRESLECRRAYSSYFHRDFQFLQQLIKNPNCRLEMQRRFYLLAMATGQSARLSANHPLRTTQGMPDHRNSAWWQRLPPVERKNTPSAVPLLQLFADALRETPVRILDVGAASWGHHTEPYAPLMQAGCAEVIGFEPDTQACAELNALYRAEARYRYLPAFIGDGGPATFYETNWSKTGYLFKPNTPLLERFEQLGEVTALKATHPVETVRLMDIPEAADIDLIKIDVQGAELAVFEGAGERLDQVLVIWTEVEFIPLYENQPLFADVDRFLRERGFLLHSFDGIATRRYKPFATRYPQQLPRRGQAIWTDAIYVRDFRQLDALSTRKLKTLAVLLDSVVGAADLCLEVLLLLDQREGTDLALRYVPAAAKTA